MEVSLDRVFMAGGELANHGSASAVGWPCRVSIQVDTGQTDPACQVFLSPVDAALLGYQLIEAAREAVPDPE